MGKWKNLMSTSVDRGVLNVRILRIENYQSMKEVITKKEQQGEEITNEPLFHQLEKLKLHMLPKLGHFFLTKHALEFPFLQDVDIKRCSRMKTFSLGSVSTPRLNTLFIDIVINDAEVKDGLNKTILNMSFNSKV